MREQKRDLKSTSLVADLLSQNYGVFARRLYGRFLKRSFVGRELVTGKFDAKLVSHAHSHVINSENACFEFFSIENVAIPAHLRLERVYNDNRGAANYYNQNPRRKNTGSNTFTDSIE